MNAAGDERLINISGDNIWFIGYGATVQMNRSVYAPGEQRHAVDIRGGTNIVIEGLAANDSGGDGETVAPVGQIRDNAREERCARRHRLRDHARRRCRVSARRVAGAGTTYRQQQLGWPRDILNSREAYRPIKSIAEGKGIDLNSLGQPKKRQALARFDAKHRGSRGRRRTKRS